VKITFDPVKNERNVIERRLSFERAKEFDFDTAFILIDERQDYGEVRYVAVGYLATRLHVLGFIETQDGIRVFSFRKANQREVVAYAKAKETN
jgi:uncharacterized protein